MVKKFLAYMEPADSSPFSQKPAIAPYHEPVQLRQTTGKKLLMLLRILIVNV
jgi:hypothetical protein